MKLGLFKAVLMMAGGSRKDAKWRASLAWQAVLVEKPRVVSRDSGVQVKIQI